LSHTAAYTNYMFPGERPAEFIGKGAVEVFQEEFISSDRR